MNCATYICKCNYLYNLFFILPEFVDKQQQTPDSTNVTIKKRCIVQLVPVLISDFQVTHYIQTRQNRLSADALSLYFWTDYKNTILIVKTVYFTCIRLRYDQTFVVQQSWQSCVVYRAYRWHVECPTEWSIWHIRCMETWHCRECSRRLKLHSCWW